jgi:hypothetical protein
MTSTAGLLIIIGLFVIVNSKNFVDVFNGKMKLNVDTAASTATPGQTPVVNAQTGFVTGTKSISGG